MSWIQVTLQTSKAQCDTAEQALLNAGALSVTYKDAEDKPVLEPLPNEMPLWNEIILTGLFDAGVDTKQVSTQIKHDLNKQISLKIEALEDKDWVRAWMDDYKPMQFGRRLWVCPKHISPPQPDAVNLMLDPGLAFGTGTHPTTALCLEWLDSINVKLKKVLDFGCGSGVLGIAALLLGADHCVGTDIDPQAILASKDNANENKVEAKIDLFLPADMPNSTYDIVIANILAGPLTELAEQLAQYCKAGGQIALSGILETQSVKIIKAYEPWFDLDPIAVKGEWIRVTGRKR